MELSCLALWAPCVRGRAYVREMAKAGIDSIKFLLSSDDAFTPGGSQKLTYSEEEVAAIGDEAQKCGVYLACHAQAAEAVKRAARHGFRAKAGRFWRGLRA